MKMRILGVFFIVLGLACVLTWAVAAQEGLDRAMSDVVSTGPPATLTQALQNSTRLGYTSAITFTPAFTTYLSVILRDYGTCSPVLISPADGSDLTTLIPLLKWDNGNNPNATEAWVQVSQDLQFTRLQHNIWSPSQGVHEYQIRRNLAPSTTYYWRSWLLCDEIRAYSDVWSFTTGSGGIILPAPALIAPADGSTTSSSQVVYQWAAVDGTKDYTVWVFPPQQQAQLSGTIPALATKRTQELTSPSGWVYQFTTTETHITHTLSIYGTYEWWVQARNDYAMGEASEHWEFNALD